MPANGKKVTIKFEQEKETKNKVRYTEQDTEHVGTLYIAKGTVEKLGNPESLKVVVEAQ